MCGEVWGGGGCGGEVLRSRLTSTYHWWWLACLIFTAAIGVRSPVVAVKCPNVYDYTQTREDHDSEWLATVKFLLSEFNLYEHYANPALASGDQFSKICKTEIKELFLQQWNARLMGLNIDHPQSSKLKFYKLFKTNFTREPYLTEISAVTTNQKLRLEDIKTLTQRSGSVSFVTMPLKPKNISFGFAVITVICEPATSVGRTHF